MGNIDPTQKQRGRDKLARIPIKIKQTTPALPKPNWIRIKLPPTNAIAKIKKMLRDNRLHTVCEEASCPNLPECFGNGNGHLYDHGG